MSRFCYGGDLSGSKLHHSNFIEVFFISSGDVLLLRQHVYTGFQWLVSILNGKWTIFCDIIHQFMFIWFATPLGPNCTLSEVSSSRNIKVDHSYSTFHKGHIYLHAMTTCIDSFMFYTQFCRATFLQLNRSHTLIFLKLTADCCYLLVQISKALSSVPSTQTKQHETTFRQYKSPRDSLCWFW